MLYAPRIATVFVYNFIVSKVIYCNKMESLPSTSLPLNDLLSPRKKRKVSHFTENEKSMIVNVFKNVEETWPADKYRSKQDMKNKTANILGISKSAVYRILKEFVETDTVKPAALPKKRVSILDRVNEYESCIRKIVHSFYIKGESPTTKKVLQVMNDDESLPNLGLTSLKKILKHLKLKYIKRRRNSGERDDVGLWNSQPTVEDTQRSLARSPNQMFIKVEPLEEKDITMAMDTIKDESTDICSDTAQTIKTEPVPEDVMIEVPCQERLDEHYSELYLKHEIKDELVISPEELQPASYTTTKAHAVTTK